MGEGGAVLPASGGQLEERISFRIAVLVSACVLTFGSYWCYDIPGAMTDSLESQYGITQAEYSLLYSVYSLPNTILPLCSGWLIDRVFGFRLGGLVACSLVLLGQAIWAFGSFFVPHISAYYLALIGRFVFGLGGETLSVVQSGYCAKWFKSKELALAFGIVLSFSRIGSAVNLSVTPIINNVWKVQGVLWVGTLLCIVSLAACVALMFLDWRGDKSRKNSGDFSVDETIELSAIFRFPLSLYLVMGICVTFYVTVFSFITISSSEFTYLFGLSTSKADFLTSIPYLLAAIICPVGGILVDKLGRHILWVLGSCFAIMYAHLLLVVAPTGESYAPLISVLIIGLAYTICAASLWPSVALLVKTSELGTAYGTMTSVQNTGLAIAPFVVGLITNDPQHPNYRGAEAFFAGCGLASFLLSLGVLILDRHRARKLSVSPQELETRLKVEALAQEEFTFASMNSINASQAYEQYQAMMENAREKPPMSPTTQVN